MVYFQLFSLKTTLLEQLDTQVSLKKNLMKVHNDEIPKNGAKLDMKGNSNHSSF